MASKQQKNNDEKSTDLQMQKGRSRGKQLIRAGIFAFLGFVILIVGVFVMGDQKQLFTKTFAVYTNFRNVEGLKSGAHVTLSGIRIGTVSGVRLLMDTSSYVRVDMVIDAAYWKFIRTNTVAVVAQQGIIGDKLIDLQMGDPEAPLVADGDSIPSVPPTNYFAIVDDARTAVQNAQNITASLDTLFLRFRRGEGTLGKLLTDDAAYTSLVEVSGSAQRLFDATSKQLSDMANTLTNAAQNVDAITAETKNLMADLGKGKGTIGALLYDRSLYDSLESLSATMNNAADAAGFAAREFGINMRNLRGHWLLGGLFGGQDAGTSVELKSRELELRLEELRRQKELLDQRERQLKELQQKDDLGAKQ